MMKKKIEAGILVSIQKSFNKFLKSEKRVNYKMIGLDAVRISTSGKKKSIEVVK